MQTVPQVILGRPATYEDLIRVPGHLIAEIVDGELWTSPRPAPTHAWASSTLAGLLNPAFSHGRGGPGGWWIIAEPEIHLRTDVLVPDFAGWRRERMSALPQTAFFPLAPDWVCEIISPSTARLDRGRKLRIYARESVRHAWIIDPFAQTIEVLRLERSRWVLASTYDGHAIVRIEPLDAIDLELPLLWGDPVPAGSDK
ncbi:MAG TPA: Uma2 family endonuclease, partial [Vicinamibacterales bacterium]|nr:Uma2 family endonuclease [Vicinamibacterales bacterium]